ncbi:MAG: helix-turn-helix transcriptional regulator [Lachnospiraceae bacterium]|nr:helix-turn-helix transcriptional regulator [Lachnospiraceae bacterium]
MAKNMTVWESFHNMADIGEHRLIANTDECVVVRLDNETGEGDMIVYQVFDGVYLMYNDFHISYYNSEFQTIETILAIDYCREGVLQTEQDNGFSIVKKTGNVCIDSRVHHKGKVFFPTSHFHGITIGFEKNVAEKTLKEEVKGIPVDIGAIRDKFCGNGQPFLLKEDENLKSLFTALYKVPDKVRTEYFRAKVLELLVYLSAIELDDLESEKPYFYNSQIEKVNAIHKLITSAPEHDYTIEELSKRYDLSQTTLKKCFKSIYGKPIHAYMTEFRMQKAAELLKGNEKMSIGDIAFTVGYESGGKFSAAFKKTMGMTPSEYRNQPH